jgi:hypothetical protein
MEFSFTLVTVSHTGCGIALSIKFANCMMTSDRLPPPIALPSRKHPLPTGLDSVLSLEPSGCGSKFKNYFLAGSMRWVL